MKEIEVKIASRYVKRKQSVAVGKNLLKTLTEPVTNSDDSYRILSPEIQSNSDDYPITIYVDKRNRLVKIIDNAEGMTTKELGDKFKEYGAAKSGSYKGYATRGIFGQGLSDVLFYHSQGIIKSIKNGEASICSFYEKRERRFIRPERQRGSVDKFSKKWGINSNHGTVVEFVLDKDTLIQEYENLAKKLSSFCMLRLINTDETRRIVLIYIDARGGKRKSVIKYYPPKGDLVEHKEFIMPFENYNPVKIDIELYKSKEPLQTIGDEKENGLIVFDDKKSVYDLTLFGLDNQPGVDRFYGFMKLTGAREIILDKISDKKHPEEILTDSRDGFNTQHEFYKKLSGIIKDWLYPILNEEKREQNDESLSEVTREKHKKAFDELNKLYRELTGEDISGTIRTTKITRPAGGLAFARRNISITANKHYGLQLIIDTLLIKPGSIIELNSSKKIVGFSPAQIEVVEPSKECRGILTKIITITGNIPRRADTLEARFKRRYASVVISVVNEEVFYPENGFGFHPEYFRAIVNRESVLNLYIDLTMIKQGTKIKIISLNDSIKLLDKSFHVPRRLRSTSRIAKLEVRFVGEKKEESSMIEAVYENYSAQARVDIKDRIPSKQLNLGGKFKDWAFDEIVSIPFQATYDSMQGSPTQGFILINPNHPINKKFFGESPKKSDIESSSTAQLYLAELILSESLNVTIPDAIQKGALPKRSDYDVLYYIAQKKYEYGPIIYSLFVEKQSALGIKRQEQIKEISKNDEDIIQGLEDRERQMVEMRFGLNDQRPHTLEEIGFELGGITRERVRQIISKALAKKFGDYSYQEESDASLHDYIKEQEEKIGTKIDKIIAAVADFYGIKLNELKARTRKAEIAKPRQIAIYLIRNLMRLSFPAIGNIFKLDHTTILYAFEKITDNIENNTIIKNQVNAIRGTINEQIRSAVD